VRSDPRDDPRETPAMEEAGLKFFSEQQAWLKSNRGDAFEETQAIAKRFAERRRELVEAAVER
jgi:hypothetical protein